MFELEYLYEQLKRQTVEQNYINTLNTVLESSYDTSVCDNAINETMILMEEVSKKKDLGLLKTLKTYFSTAEKILSANKDAALKCKPYGLNYEKFKTFMSDEEIKSMHKKALSYLNKFDPSKASEEELKKYIMDSMNNVQYKEIVKIFGKGKESFMYRDMVVTKTTSKELNKNDISASVKYLETFTDKYKKLQKEFRDTDNEYGDYVKKTGLATAKTNHKNIEKLRQNAMNHKKALINITDCTFFNMYSCKLQLEFQQAKRVVVKAANHNPRNLKESAKIQMYIDAMYDFHEEI